MSDKAVSGIVEFLNSSTLRSMALWRTFLSKLKAIKECIWLFFTSVYCFLLSWWIAKRNRDSIFSWSGLATRNSSLLAFSMANSWIGRGTRQVFIVPKNDLFETQTNDLHATRKIIKHQVHVCFDKKNKLAYHFN